MELIPGGAIENYLTFDGKCSRDFGVWISGGGTFDAPARDIQTVQIPGRNGDLTFDNGRYQNIMVTYPAFISRAFRHRIDEFRAFMCSKVGYCRLEDTYHPEEFRMGLYSSGLNVTTTAGNRAGRFNLSFNCKPQRWRKDGEIQQRFTKSGAIFNPTFYPARPLVRAYGTGTFSINGIPVRITAANGYTDIDCESMDAFRGSVNCNNNVVLVDGEFPEIAAGENTVTMSGLSAIEITPRWWTL